VAEFGSQSGLIFRRCAACPILALAQCLQMPIRRKRSALVITETELKLIARAAIRGESSKPLKG
jgi:hypothetical protein